MDTFLESIKSLSTRDRVERKDMFEVSEYEDATIFKNVVLPGNYRTIDNKSDFTSTTKVSQICNDLAQAIGENGINCGLIKLQNGTDFVGFYYKYPKYVSITLGTYGNDIYLIGLINNNPYTRVIKSTTPS